MKLSLTVFCSLLVTAAAVATTNDVDFAYTWSDLNWSAAALQDGLADLHLRDDLGHKTESGGTNFCWQAPEIPMTDTLIVEDSAGTKFIQFDMEASVTGVLTRTIVPRTDPVDPIRRIELAPTNGAYAGFYADATIRFKPFTELEEPIFSPDDKVLVWTSAITAEDGDFVPATNLYVSAGSFVGSVTRVKRRDFKIAVADDFDFFDWHRVTIRTLADITLGARVTAFEVFLDGKPVTVAADDDYDLLGEITGPMPELTPEARDLMNRRMLFPSLADAGTDEALFTAGAILGGRGAAQNLNLVKDAPEEAFEGEAVFTLSYDAGVTGFVYAVEGLWEPQEVVDFSGFAGKVEIPLRGKSEAIIKITDVKYRNDLGWQGERGDWWWYDCELDGDNFVYSAESGLLLPKGSIVTKREGVPLTGEVDLNGAYEQAMEAGTNLVYLVGEVVATAGLDLPEYAELIIDLCGHELKNADSENPLLANCQGGSLTICDSVGGGRLTPYKPLTEPTVPVVTYENVAPHVRGTNVVDVQHAVVYNRSTKAFHTATTVIEGGIFDGLVIDSEQVEGLVPEGELGLRVKGGEFMSTNEFVFALQDNLVNKFTYYEYVAPYWHQATTERAFVWVGKDEVDPTSFFYIPENWLCHEVPEDGDLVIFPKAEKPWVVNFSIANDWAYYGTWWIRGDVELHGTNYNASALDWRTHLGEGRLSGDALLVFTNLAAKTDLSTLLATNWAGTVKIAPPSSSRAEALASVMGTWGTADSVVIMNGVRGAVSDRYDHLYPFELVLEDNGELPAWRNDGGYNGSILTFRKVSGAGTLMSPKNTIAVKQVMRFLDVLDYTGRFVVGGKRFQLGAGTPATSVDAGAIVYASDFWVRSGLGWEATNAVFGAKLKVLGATNDVLLTVNYKSTAKPVLENTIVTVSNLVTAAVTTNQLAFAAEHPHDIVFTDDSALSLVEGEVMTASTLKKTLKTMASKSVGSPLKSTSSLKLGSTASVGEDGHSIVSSEGETLIEVPGYYSLSQDENGAVEVQLTEAALPVMGGEGDEQAAFIPKAAEDGKDVEVGVGITGAHVGLFYGLQQTTDLNAGFANPGKEEWQTPLNEGEAIELNTTVTGECGFMRVVVTDDPDSFQEEAEEAPVETPKSASPLMIKSFRAPSK